MKQAAALAFVLLAAASAQAQDAAQERTRIQSERQVAQQRFATEEKACRTKFQVTACLDGVRRARNAALGELRRQERVLDDEERRRRSAERQHELDERLSPERQRAADEKREKALQEQADRDRRAAEKAEKRAHDEAERAANTKAAKSAPGPSGPQGSARAPHAPKPPTIDAAEAAKNRQANDARLKEAADHRKAVEERIAKRTKPAASGLPTPP